MHRILCHERLPVTDWLPFRPNARWIIPFVLTSVGSGLACRAVAESPGSNRGKPTISSRDKSAPTHSIEFNRDIRPIFTQYCTSCHGGVKSAGDVSFVYANQVLPPDGWVVEPGDAASSILWQRIVSDDESERMPPPDEHPDPLPPEKIALIQRWIDSGAEWQDHWSMTRLMDPVLPVTDGPMANWPRQALDSFVLRRLVGQQLMPSAEASPGQWLRRVSLDLTGLPPTLDQLEAFRRRVAEASHVHTIDVVYASEVDRLLATDGFGERWASLWMDLARYADSMGFEKDPHRDMWPYRDWLIRAFNEDLPFDQFTIKQLAGDLIPGRATDDLIATAFHRNTQTNTEGGTDDEEFRIAAVIDRVNTTWTVWQATTFGCVQCHAHPYDPIRHEEYYACLAMFNNTLDADLPNDFPTIRVDGDDTDGSIRAAFELDRYRERRNAWGIDLLDASQWQPMVPKDVTSSGGRLKQRGATVFADGGTFPPGVTYTVDFPATAMTAMRIEIMPSSVEPLSVPEKGSLLTQLQASLVGPSGEETKLTFSDVFTKDLVMEGDPSDALKNNNRGVGEYPKLNATRTAVFVLSDALLPDDGNLLRLKLVQKASTAGGIATHLRRFRWSSTEDDDWTSMIRSKEYNATKSSLQEAAAALANWDGASLPILADRPRSAARSTGTFIRGNWLDRGDPVQPAIPNVFQTQRDPEAPSINDRLDLARWLVSDENPMAARVWVNRIWSQLFGIGLVETQEDFGSSGQLPSHPALIDHLATRFRDHHRWHLKPLLREWVLSSTYRQNNAVSVAQLEADFNNRYLGRGPRTRLSAEMVRDQSLAVAGLMTQRLGGPSVMPPQPDGIWQAVYSGAKWKTAVGADRYRRALYTYWRRTSPYPSFLMFDAPTRDVCAARRVATNTPLQALVTLNDPVYIECAEALAETAVKRHGPPSDASKSDEPSPDHIDACIESMIQWMLLAVTQQPASDLELTELTGLYHDLCETDEHHASIDRASLAIVANTILNLDKAMTK